MTAILECHILWTLKNLECASEQIYRNALVPHTLDLLALLLTMAHCEC